MKLYWVTTFDHGEDWFVAADNAAEAKEFFAGYNGYDVIDDEADAKLVGEIPIEFRPPEPDFADEDLIQACGGEMKLFDDHDVKMYVDQSLLDSLGASTRVVLINNKIYVEGNVMRVALQYLKNQPIQ